MDVNQIYIEYDVARKLLDDIDSLIVAPISGQNADGNSGLVHEFKEAHENIQIKGEIEGAIKGYLNSLYSGIAASVSSLREIATIAFENSKSMKAAESEASAEAEKVAAELDAANQEILKRFLGTTDADVTITTN